MDSFIETEPASSSFEIQIPRGGKLRVNSVPKYLIKFREILKMAIPIVADELDPGLRRKNFNATFLPTIIDKEGIGREVLHYGGIASFGLTGNQNLEITLSLDPLPPRVGSLAAAVKLLHEIFEMNFWVQSQRLKDRPKQVSFRDQKGYSKAEHEVIADSKTAVCLQKALGARVEFLETGQIQITAPEKYKDDS